MSWVGRPVPAVRKLPVVHILSAELPPLAAEQPQQAEPSRSIAEHRQRVFRTLRRMPAHRPAPFRNFCKSRP
jgi:hypothetical protein